MADRNSEPITDSRKRRRIFERRAASVLKQTREIATLCSVPACVILRNPDGWRTWPENRAELGSVIDLYKSKIVAGEGCNGLKERLNGMTSEQAMNMMVDVDRKIADLQAKIDRIANNNHNVLPPASQQPAAAAAAENDNVMEQQQPEPQQVDDGNLWYNENELFDVTEFLNSSDVDETLTFPETVDDSWLCLVNDISGSSADCNVPQPAVVQGTSGPPERVFTFADLMSPSKKRM